MKIQRKIAVLLCCLAFMGTLSFDALSAQAAVICRHEQCEACFAVKAYHYEEDGHYEEWGPLYTCGNCGYSYWGNNMVRKKVADHEFIHFMWEYSSELMDVYVAPCETPECPYELKRIYTK